MLKAEVASLDGVDEKFHDLYEKNGDGFRLKVEGVEFESEVEGLRSALDTERKARAKAERTLRDTKAQIPEGFSPEKWDELTEAERQREEDKAKAEGKWDELRERLNREHEATVEKLKGELTGERDRYKSALEQRLVTGELKDALLGIGVRTGLLEAAVALMEKKYGPRIEWDGDSPVGVFPDELHGNKPIAEAVQAWAETEEAGEYIEASGKRGGGSTEHPKRGGSAAVKSKADLKTAMDNAMFIKEHGVDAYLDLPAE